MYKGKKITFISYSNFPFGGAMANFSRYFVGGLAMQENIVEVILPTGNYYGNKVDCVQDRKGISKGVSYRHLCYINHPKNYLGKILDNICGYILPIFYLIKKSIKRDLDIIVVADTEFLKTLMFVITKKILRKKLVIILPEFYDKPEGSIVSISGLNWYSFYFGLKYTIKYADRFIVLSTFMKSYLIKTLKIRKGILVIPNLTDPEEFKINNVKPYLGDKITIGYIGTPTKKDGILDLIQSFGLLNKKFPNTHLLIIGDITNGKSVIPQLLSFAEEKGINKDCITFTGLQSRLVVPQLLLSCQILALTRPRGIFAEAGFPTKLGEYFSCRKPVLITKVGDIPVYFEDGQQAVLVEPENVQSIVSGFEKIITDKNLQERLMENGYNWMEVNLNFIQQTKRISEFLNS